MGVPMELPLDDGGLDLGDAPPLLDEVPSEGEELVVLPDNDILGDSELLGKKPGGCLGEGLE